METLTCDFLIIGAGIIGLTTAYNLKQKFPFAKIIIIEKEADVASHASGRNSGVLHAGFYYHQDSLKAKFCKEGNIHWKNFCKEYNLKINQCAKVVVAQNENEVSQIYALYERGLKNNVELKIIDEKELQEIDPNAKTTKVALFSPLTATINPTQICQFLKNFLISQKVYFYFKEPFLSIKNQHVITKNYKINAHKVINCAGVYADKIAKNYGFAQHYSIIPFKGVYLYYTLPDNPIRTNIYPLPHAKNPFLGVHFTLGVDNEIKIGPTATPAFWRENYNGLKRFCFAEFVNISLNELKLLLLNKSNFRSLAIEEIKKYNKNYLISIASKLVKNINPKGFNKWGKPGIRAQLINTKTLQLVEDFIIEADDNSIHVLNSVSPAFTASIPFTKYIIQEYIK